MATIKHAQNGKRDLHGLEHEFNNAYHKLQTKEKWKHETNRETVLAYLEACLIGKAKSGKANKRVGNSTLYRVMGILRLLSEDWIKKPFEQTTQSDWDNFYKKMELNKIKNQSGQPFKPSTKAKNYKTIRKFLKWKFGENKYYPDYCVDWVTSEEKTTKEHITKTELDRMIEATQSLKIKTLLSMLFDGGFRIEEVANLRWKDLTKTKDGYYRAHVRQETSKTKTERHVTLPLATSLIESYQIYSKQKKDESGKLTFNTSEYLFQSTYGNLYNTVRQVGQRVLNKKISPHTMRHSSATYYADIIKTYQQFCSRYGWRLNSETPQRYFHKRDDDLVAEQATENLVSKYKAEFEKLKVEKEQLNETINEMQDRIERQDAKLEAINIFLENPQFKEMIAKINKK